MPKEIRIEQLEASDRTEVLEVLAQAFKDIPSPRLETKPKIMRILVSTIRSLFDEKIGRWAMVYLFGGFANLPSYGIRKDGKLVCVASIGLSKMVIIDRKEYDKRTKELACLERSVAFFDKMDTKGWLVLLSLLALVSALMVSFVNWPVFEILSWFGVEIEADFLVPFLGIGRNCFYVNYN